MLLGAGETPGWETKIQVPADSVFGEGHRPVVSSDILRGNSSLSSSYEGTNSIIGALPSRLYLNLTTFKVLVSKYHPIGEQGFNI